ncbi:MAG TPA: hypothetical protein VK467_09755 [Gemmatimonadales bacterium]|nr:hypothetical protein [Gemmatimonadales bacterium]
MRLAVTPFLIVLALCSAACRHEASFSWAGPDTVGPFPGPTPRRLTFNPGDDRTPSVTGDLVVFSRLDGFHGRERCIALLAAAGGTLHRTMCPLPPVSPADTFVDTWVEPVLSPDGRQIAFVWQEGSPAGYYTWTRYLVVAPATDPAHPTFRWQSWYVLPDGRTATALSKPMWLGPTTIRFLASYERVFKVKGGGAERLTDTLMDAYTLVDLELASGGGGAVGIVRGADSTIAYAAVASGGFWLVKSSDSTRLLFLAPGADSAVTVTSFSGPVVDLTDVEGVPVALLSSGTTVEWIDVPTGVVSRLSIEMPLRRIAVVPGTRRFVAEVENTADPLASIGANLWLFSLP